MKITKCSRFIEGYCIFISEESKAIESRISISYLKLWSEFWFKTIRLESYLEALYKDLVVGLLSYPAMPMPLTR